MLFHSARSLQHMKPTIAILLIAIASASPCWGQVSAAVVSGKVISESGNPIEDVDVYGTKTTCCPATVSSTKTNPNGTFNLDGAGAVLHFRRNGLQPVSLIVEKDMLPTVVMKNQEPTAWAIPVCGPKEPPRFGQTFLFLRPAGQPLARGQDIDYTRFGAKGHDRGWLDSWFGATASSVDASEEFFLKSVSFSERFVEVPGFGLVGIDARGISKDGKHWRWVGLRYALGEGHKSLMGTDPYWRWPRQGATDMVRYDNASEEEATQFDKTIDSACVRSM
jgi:hypothetical protein